MKIEKLSLVCQLKLIAGASVVLFLILILGVVLPNSDDLRPDPVAEVANETIPVYTNTSLVIISNSTDPINEERRDFIRALVNSTWASYVDHAKGILVRPKRKEDAYLTDNTLAASLSTLWILDLKEQFNTTWDLFELNYLKSEAFWKHGEIHVQKMVTEVLGSLLSLYSLTEEDRFLDAAKNIVDKLGPAYDNRTGKF